MAVEACCRGRSQRVGYGAVLSGQDGFTVRNMHTIELNDEELRLLRYALRSYLQAFGHDEADQLRAAKHLMMRLPDPATTANAG